MREILILLLCPIVIFGQKINILLKSKNQNSYEAENNFWGNISLNFFKEYGIETQITVANSIKGSASANYIPYIETALNKTENSQFDIIQIDIPYIGVFENYLEDLSLYKTKFSNKYINGILNNLFGKDNKLKGIPLHLDFGVLFTNLNNEIPTTYDEMFDICKKKNYINNNCYMYQNSGEAYSAVINEWLFDSNNGQYISEQAIIDLTNQNIKDFINKLSNNKNLLPNIQIINSDGLVNKLNNNETMYSRNWLSTFNFHKNKTVYILPYEKSISSTLGGFFLGVAKNRNYVNLDNIITFLLYITNENIQYTRLTQFNHIPSIPINTTILSEFCHTFPCDIISRISIVTRPSKFSQVKDKYREVSTTLISYFNLSNTINLEKLQYDIQQIINPILPNYIIIIIIISISIIFITIILIVIFYKMNTKININNNDVIEHKEDLEVLNSYSALNNDELSVDVGDFIHIEEIFSDNWAFGINKQKNIEGILPMYVFGNVYKSANTNIL